MPVFNSPKIIQFHYTEPSFTFQHRTALKAFILDMFKKEKVALQSLDCIFCSDQYLLNINRQFLKHDYYTDIITFELSAKNEPIVGEIYISIDRVKENAVTLNQLFRNELHRVIFHGCLHLCGYKDKSRQQIKVMRSKEAYYLKKYGQLLGVSFL